MPMVEDYDLVIDRGADWDWTIRWKVGRTKRTAVPKDTTGYLVRMQIRRSRDEDPEIAPLVFIDNGDEGGIEIGSDFSFQFHLSHQQTSVIPEPAAGMPDKGVFDVEAESPEGRITKLTRGTVLFNPDITKPPVVVGS
jgi:hypothetical protein